MTDHRNNALKYAKEHQPSFLATLSQFVSIPSISTNPENKNDMLKAANWLVEHMGKIGLENAKVMPTKGHPVVYADWMHAPGKPTVLVYGHYDVQPVDPIELWNTGPFEAKIDGDYMHGRGTSDMKGQVMATLNAIESIMQSGHFPVNLKFCYEGEEEIGSPSMAEWLEENKQLLTADLCLNPDAGMLSKETPTLTKGLRGLAYFELKVTGPDHDLHSGMAGGIIHNPAQALAELISKMHDEDGKITLPGFYDPVYTISPEEHEEFAQLPHDEAFFKEYAGVDHLWGEKEFIAAERLGGRPTLEINGIIGGFTGEGQKTVLPAWAMAKISCRLVPDQDPEQVHRQMKDFLSQHAPKTIRWELKKLSGSPASVVRQGQPGLQAMANALETEWGKQPVYPREGGSIPIVGYFQKIVGVGSVLTGFGLPDDNLHAPNEHLHLPTWSRGTRALIHFFFNL